MNTFEKPIVLAPMAGGPSTPELCAAVSNAGGLGFLAAGYLTPEKLSEHVRATESLTDRPFGINLFYPSEPNTGRAGAYEEYRRLLIDECECAGEFPENPRWSDDDFEAKFEIALGSRAEFVSFTFGYPTAERVERVRGADKLVVLNATTPREVDHVIDLGCDVVVLQGKAAGGHRGSVLDVGEEGYSYDARELLEYAAARADVPIFVGGGVGSAGDVRELLEAGADAVVVGTRFLTATEGGTKVTHRRALLEFGARGTVVTRAFSGKPARAIVNGFVERFSGVAPVMYPEVHYLTAGMRARANEAGDAECLNLWAGEGFRYCREAPASEIMAELLALP
ncbi:MAG: nitronate monooxygenase [Actinomycetaceae bacterium]|nr:nitronate monooxygenase [Actinomycetaceae bacterium]